MTKLSCIAALAAVAAVAGAAPPTTATAPTSAPAAGEAVMKILRAMEAAGKKYPTITADIDYHLNKTLVGDTQLRTGNVAFSRSRSRGTGRRRARFRVHFATLKRGSGKTAAVRVDYAFDGMWLSKADYSLRQITRYQYAAKGQNVDPLRLGKGPFPVPFGQKVADVLKYFKVTLVPAEPKDKNPPGSDHLLFTTRRGHRRDISYSSLDLWIDRKSHLSVKIRARERKSRDIVTVTFKNIKPGAKLDRGIFLLPRPRGWKDIIKPLKTATDVRPR